MRESLIVETRQMAHDRGFSDARRGKLANAGYDADDNRPQVSTRLLTYYTGYGEGCFANREGRLPTVEDHKLTLNQGR